MNDRRVLNVSHLPEHVLDHHAPIWWGNILMLAIETTVFALLIATYFYLRINFNQWPPPRVDQFPIIHNPLPKLLIPTTNMILLVLSLIPMIIIDRAALRRDARTIKFGLLVSILFCAGALILRFYEFPALYFKWNDNAYASAAWTLLGMHLFHLMVASGEILLMSLWMFLRGLDDKHALDIRTTAVYWYWVVGIWLPIYGIVFWGPRFY
jgi:heme/copper-type cytochrome/quinol oxidase subunit 3